MNIEITRDFLKENGKQTVDHLNHEEYDYKGNQ